MGPSTTSGQSIMAEYNSITLRSLLPHIFWPRWNIYNWIKTGRPEPTVLLSFFLLIFFLVFLIYVSNQTLPLNWLPTLSRNGYYTVYGNYCAVLLCWTQYNSLWFINSMLLTFFFVTSYFLCNCGLSSSVQITVRLL